MTKFNFHQLHTHIHFKIKHLILSQLKPTFNQFHLQLHPHINHLTSLKPTPTIIPTSIHTQNHHTHNHLTSNHFFPTQHNHKMTFLTKQINQNQLLAHLTIKPQTHQHTFHLQFNRLTKNPINPQQLTPFILTPTINRQK
ncbi:YceI family protein, partial [Staphylococcus epidermidis]|uniref:YceI family protein n=1 Tax=Staphylococcus epidermidis TaxID=1282 RepID=UPI0011A4F7E8